MGLRRKIGWTLAVLFGLSAAAVAAAPYIANVEAYKPAIIAAVKEATGRELVIEGPLKLSMFPEPRISARQVRFANALGAKGAQMVNVRWIGASPSWWALLRGEVEVGNLILYQPAIVLETDAEGRPNWEFEPGAGATQPAGAPSAGMHLAIGRLRIVQGTLSYTNPKSGKTLTAEQIDATASVGSFNGPFAIAGTATVNGVPLALDLSVGGPTDKGHETTLKLKVQSGTLAFDGHLSRISPDADMQGKLSLTTGGLTDFIAAVMGAVGQEPPKFGASVIGSFAFDGGIEISAERFALTDFKTSMAGETASGSLALTGGATPSLEGRISVPKVDAEKWLALLSEPGMFQPASSIPKDAAPPKTPSQPASLSPFPPQLAVSLSLDAMEVVYRRGTVRDLALAVEIHKGVITVPRLNAVLPGDMVLQANATAPAAPPPVAQGKPGANSVQSVGELSLVGHKLRETLAWLDVDVSGIPSAKLQSLALKGKLTATANGVQIAGLIIDVDDQRSTGSGSVTFGLPLVAAASIQLERFDLDAYMPLPPPDPVVPAPTLPIEAVVPLAAPTAPPDKYAPTLGLKAKVGKLVYRGEILNGVDADLSMQGNLLKLNGIKVADLLGAKLDLRGQVADFGTTPRFDVTFNTTMPDTEKLLIYAGLPTFKNGKIGAATAGGSVSGTMSAFTLREATVTMLGATARASGALTLGEKFGFNFSNFALQAGDASRLVSVAAGRNQSGIGAISATGTFKGDADRAAFDGTLVAAGTQMAGSIGATLGERPNISVNLRVPGTLDFDAWLGVSAGPVPAAPSVAPLAAPLAPMGTESAPLPAAAPRVTTSKPIDLSALRAFDATLNLETSAIAVASLKVNYADMQASLRNGVFTIAKLTGQFYGGAVDFAGTVDASRAALSVDLRGSLQGIYLGEMLRGSAGTNIFGNEHLMVSVDGKITVMDIRVQGQGNTPEQIRDSLVGHGLVSGYVYPSVTAGSLGFASFATGIGSIFSTEMGFSSAVLGAFVNIQSAISGDLTLADGAVNLQNHRVQGQNAVAVITSKTSLTAATTDTTIALDIGTRGSTDYVMTVKGPVSSPTMSTKGR